MSTAPLPISPELEEILSGAATRGRRSTLQVGKIEALTEEDLLAANEADAIKPASLKDIRHSHHEVAKLLARGERQAVIHEITGYSASRISILQNDPQFADLVEHYSEIEEEAHVVSRADFHEKLSNLGHDSIGVLHQKLLDEPESFTPSELLKIVEASADRIGHGKTSTVNTNNAHLFVTAEDLSAIREATAAREANPTLPQDHGSLLRLAVRATESHPDGEEASGVASEGDQLREEGEEGREA